MPRSIRVRELAGWVDPEAAFLAVAAAAPVVAWLDGGAGASSGRSVIAVAHDRTERLLVADAADPDGVLERLRARIAASDAAIDGDDSGGERTALGWIGWFGYEFGARRLGLPFARAATPDAAFFFADRAIVFDHERRSVRFEWLDDADGDDAGSGRAWADDTANALGETAVAAAATPTGPPAGPGGGEFTADAAPLDRPSVRWRHDATAYARMIVECQAAIRRGDAYQLCLTNRVDVDVRPDPVGTYLRLRRSSPSHHGGYLRFGDIALLSASPEQFLFVERDSTVSTRPMKGTRPRGTDADSDRMLRAELADSEKERAENLMIVDLMRNDLARIAELGTVHVPVLLETEEYPHVHQLVSTVRARLRHPLTAVDAVAAAFPAGSMTGAPKESAMRLLHGLEHGPRGVYSGAFGTLAVDGSADLAMVIRSIVLTPDGASIGTGGGITALSDPEAEIEETRVKARALLDALTGRDAPPIE
ncbi:aminodeoxychorismate synthase component I [Agromyces sp. CFH 90414]|uniref:aminodeoxychorismate synthase n=1 Tax=Agromyces agglutinans TaxID=2662258 RepID=A0A6I2FFU7_9MICO|nr:aminodeoxychorismate synthase component I [Agromyces agglutinans]MRG61550.1 aminodeoxychorismate synthase component I [Agromyces agglutinans]